MQDGAAVKSDIVEYNRAAGIRSAVPHVQCPEPAMVSPQLHTFLMIDERHSIIGVVPYYRI